MTIRIVTHTWDDSLGNCSDCGDPAAYAAPNRYGEGKPLTDSNLLCAVCAAQEACEGETIIYLWHEPDLDGEPTPEQKRVIDHYANPQIH